MNSNERGMAAVAHVLGLFTGFLGPLIMYLIIPQEQSFARVHAKEALNFQITILIAFIVSFVLTFVLIGILGFIIFGLLDLIWSIVAAIAANDGREYRYPMSIRFIS